jgi:hypothetical protein
MVVPLFCSTISSQHSNRLEQDCSGRVNQPEHVRLDEEAKAGLGLRDPDPHGDDRIRWRRPDLDGGDRIEVEARTG